MVVVTSQSVIRREIERLVSMVERVGGGNTKRRRSWRIVQKFQRDFDSNSPTWSLNVKEQLKDTNNEQTQGRGGKRMQLYLAFFLGSKPESVRPASLFWHAIYIIFLPSFSLAWRPPPSSQQRFKCHSFI